MFSSRGGNTRQSAPDEEAGAILVEYALLVMLVVLVVLVGVAIFGSALLDLYTTNTDRFSDAINRT